MILKKYKKLLYDLAIPMWLIAIGAIMNYRVISVNHGMPTLGITSPIGKYVPITDNTLGVEWADIYDGGWFYFSMGDFLMMSGIMLAFVATVLWILWRYSNDRVEKISINKYVSGS